MKIHNSISDNIITCEGVHILLDSLKKSSIQLIHLCLRGAPLNIQNINELGEYIQSNQHLEDLEIRNCAINDNHLETLLNFIKDCKNIKNLDIGANYLISNSSLPRLLKVIESSGIENIKVGGTNITQQNLLTVPLANNILKKGMDSMNLTRK